MKLWVRTRAQQYPIDLAVVSNMDSVVKIEGEHSPGNRKNRRINYGPLLEDIGAFVSPGGYVKLCLQGHSETCSSTIRSMEAMRVSTMTPLAEDVALGEVDFALLSCGAAKAEAGASDDAAPVEAAASSAVCHQRDTLIAHHRRPDIYKGSWNAHMADELKERLAVADVLWISGECGSGKSTRVPTCLLEDCDLGMVHVLNKKSVGPRRGHAHTSPPRAVSTGGSTS